MKTSIIFACLLGTAANVVDAAEIRLLSAEVIRHAFHELSPEFERVTGHKLALRYDSAAAVKTRLQSGEATDVAIIQKPVVEAFAAQGKIVRGTVVTLARSGLALAVRKNAPRPDISSVDAFKRALLAAESIAYSDPARGAASGIQFREVIERLGIAQDVNAKAKFRSPASPRHDVELVITQPSEILAEPNLDLVGWLPDELQDYEAFSWAAGVTADAAEPDAAKQLIQFLSSPTASRIIQKWGMRPGSL
jgi:molybdate transport system substrate-binding protein